MGNHFGYTINGPQPDTIALPIRLSKSLSVRREPKLSGNNLRNLYQNPAPLPIFHRTSFSSTDNGVLGPATPVLPPTPPNVEEEIHDNVEESNASETAKARSMLTTPVNQISPPTPDNTPPHEKSKLRPFLGAQPSMSSTRAESFKTAQEDLHSDKDSDVSSPTLQPELNRSLPFLPSHLTNGVHKPSPLASMPVTNGDLTPKESSPIIPSSNTMPLIDNLARSVHSQVTNEAQFPSVHNEETPYTDDIDTTRSKHNVVGPTINYRVVSRKEGAQRARSLRDRLDESRQATHSPSIDKFASIIGWTTSVSNSAEDQKRWSIVSGTSTVEAVLIEQPLPPRKRNTLRHVSKNDSLRSASSPLPTSNRTSMQSSSDSPHRLVHKKAKLNNQNRLSFGSEMSRDISVGSNFVPKLEIIPVAIIPERSSSLQSSTTSSRKQSQTMVGAPSSFRMPHSSTGNVSSRKRAATDTTNRGRDRHYPPQVPTRGSSLSAPTSRNTSRRSSIASDHLSFEQKRAEKDLRSTLDKMETERLVSSLRSASIDTPPMSGEIENIIDNMNPDIRTQDFATEVEPHSLPVLPGSKEWAELRPTSILHTPFSASFLSASPEISEAKMISLHVHNNHSVQLIEPLMINESHAVTEARRFNQPDYLDSDDIDSPLRNPRSPPHPPEFNFIPPTPQDEIQAQLDHTSAQHARPLTPKRPVDHSRNDSFAKTLLRNVSLRNAKNKKADQELDSTLHPFWRPRPFWDGIEGSSPEKKRSEYTDRGVINNSLGLPQQRLVVTGPLGLVRRISERRRNRKALARQSSYNSLQRLRVGRDLHRRPGTGMHLHILSFRDIQDKILAVRQKKEDEKREKRREALRRSIGANVIATSDSRFPATMIGN